mgnify:CR=1 FL=1
MLFRSRSIHSSIQGSIHRSIQGSIHRSIQGAFRGAFRENSGEHSREHSGEHSGKAKFRVPEVVGGDPTEGLNGQLVLKTSIESTQATTGEPGGTPGEPQDSQFSKRA